VRDAAATAVAEEGLDSFHFFDGPSTQAITTTSDDHVFLAFRGTESKNPTDWARDAQFAPQIGELDGRVHSGFRAALNEVWAAVEASLEAAAKPIVVTGHSLGAGLAVLAAARAISSGHDVSFVYLYGCPRPGLADFRSAYDRRLQSVTFNVINHIDLVTRVPFLAQGFRHVGRRMYFDALGKFHEDAGAWHIARDDLRYRLRHFGRIQSIGLGPHEISAYVNSIEALAR
jgi:predicted lipase